MTAVIRNLRFFVLGWLALHCLSCYGSERSAGVKVSTFVDNECDGVNDICCVTDMSSLGQFPTRQECDSGCDGSTEQLTCTDGSLDDHGNARNVQMDVDCDGPGDELDMCLAYDNTYEGGESNPSMSRVDADCDGTFDFIFCSRNTYDERGNLAAVAMDSGCDGSEDYCSTMTYDSQGNMLTARVDLDCDGTDDQCSTNVY